MRFDIFTLFPRMFESPFAESIIRRAINAGLIEIHTHNIRDYATDKHRTTDDYPFGGGSGMVMKPEPIFAAVESVLGVPLPKDVPIILMSPSGRTFTHAVAKELAQYARIALICGHYEGVDERVREHLCTDAISIGDYVLTGGEIPAMVIVDAVSRLVPGVLPQRSPKRNRTPAACWNTRTTRAQRSSAAGACPTCCSAATMRLLRAGAASKPRRARARADKRLGIAPRLHQRSKQQCAC